MGYSYQTADPLLYDVLKEFARENRRHQTEAERCLWAELRANQLGHVFKRQHIIGAYIADFVCVDSKLIVEVDGGYHAQPSQMLYDAKRTQWLEEIGYKVIRFNNEDIIGNIDEVLSRIYSTIMQIKTQVR